MNRREALASLLALPLATITPPPDDDLPFADELPDGTDPTGIFLIRGEFTPIRTPDGVTQSLSKNHLRALCWDAPLPTESWRDAPLPTESWRDYMRQRPDLFAIPPGFRRVSLTCRVDPANPMTTHGRTLYVQDLWVEHHDVECGPNFPPNDQNDRVEITIIPSKS